MRVLLVPLLVLAALPSSAQNAAPEKTVSIDLSSFKFTPDTVTLEHGQRYVLHLANTSDGGHNFVAREFFEAATVDPADQARIVKGGVDLDSGQTADIHLVAPPAGTYKLHCSHFMHSAFGMKGKIVVQ